MSITDYFKKFVSPKILGASLPPVPLPKPPKGAKTLPGDRTQVTPRTSAVARIDSNLANTDRMAVRSNSDSRKLVAQFMSSSPDLSNASSAMLRTGIPEEYTAIARDMDGKIDVSATLALGELIRRMTYLGNVDGSFGTQQGLQSISEQLSVELLTTGAACAEVALDMARVPASLNPVAVTTLKIYDEKMAFRLVQSIGGVEIDLDYPTIIYVTLDKHLTETYTKSYYESAIQPVLADLDFNNDARRALKKAVLPRLKSEIDSERVKKMCPPEILADTEKFMAYKEEIITSVENLLNGLNPEDALVSYDSVNYSYLTGTQDPSSIIERVQKVLNGKLAAGAKTMPVILGLGGSSNTSSAESLIYLKQANMLRVKLNELYSRAFTVAVRLLGFDVYVEFKYATLDLKPDSELEAFKAMKQSRVLELLSLGLVSDEEACITLTGNLPPQGYTAKSGTMFKVGGTQVVQNPSSNTSAMGQKLAPTTPTQPKS